MGKRVKHKRAKGNPMAHAARVNADRSSYVAPPFPRTWGLEDRQPHDGIEERAPVVGPKIIHQAAPEESRLTQEEYRVNKNRYRPRPQLSEEALPAPSLSERPPLPTPNRLQPLSEEELERIMASFERKGLATPR